MNQQEHLEELTRSQSRFYQVVHTDPHKPALSLLSSVCYPETNRFTSAATTYGCTHEKDAVEAYKLQQSCRHDEFSVTPCGLVLSLEKPFLGASPDAFVECKCCGPGVVEVKCPLCTKSSSIY